MQKKQLILFFYLFAIVKQCFQIIFNNILFVILGKLTRKLIHKLRFLVYIV